MVGGDAPCTHQSPAKFWRGKSSSLRAAVPFGRGPLQALAGGAWASAAEDRNFGDIWKAETAGVRQVAKGGEGSLPDAGQSLMQKQCGDNRRSLNCPLVQ